MRPLRALAFVTAVFLGISCAWSAPPAKTKGKGAAAPAAPTSGAAATRTASPDCVRWPRLPPDLCEPVGRMRDMYVKLMAAGMPGRMLDLDLSYEADANAQYDPNNRTISVTASFIRLFATREKEPALAYALAHEIGHAVQDALHGIRTLRDGGATPQQVEAQADVIADQILVKAGFPPHTTLAGQEQLFGCAAIRDAAHASALSATHPSHGNRWVNSAGFQDAIRRVAAMPSLYGSTAFDGAGKALQLNIPGPAPITPALHTTAFTFDGKVRPSQLVPKEARAQLVEVLRKETDAVNPPTVGERLSRWWDPEAAARSARAALDAVLDRALEPPGARATLAAACGLPPDIRRRSDTYQSLNRGLQGDLTHLTERITRAVRSRLPGAK